MTKNVDFTGILTQKHKNTKLYIFVKNYIFSYTFGSANDTIIVDKFLEVFQQDKFTKRKKLEWEKGSTFS